MPTEPQRLVRQRKGAWCGIEEDKADGGEAAGARAKRRERQEARGLLAYLVAHRLVWRNWAGLGWAGLGSLALVNEGREGSERQY